MNEAAPVRHRSLTVAALNHKSATMHPTLLFQKLRWRLLGNSLRLLLAHSLIRAATIVACSLVIWALIFALSWAGFHELRVRWNVDPDLRTIELVLDLLFLTLSVMLTFSTGIILYSSLFVSPESHFLMASPVADDHVFAYKFQGGIAFSSWGFVLLGSPVLIAYGLEIGDGAPWTYYLALPFFILGFVLIPGSVGAAGCLVLVNIVPRHRRQVFAGILLAIGVVLAAWGYSWYRHVSQDWLSRAWFDDLLTQLSIFGGTWVPFQWVARGLRKAALDRNGDMLYYLGLVWANGLFAYVATLGLARLLYRRGLNRVASGGSLRKRYGGAWLDALVTRPLFFLSPQTRLLIVKDFRTFRRDPAQWTQILIFMGMAVLYFPNMRRFYDESLGSNFRNFISLMTLAATCLLMCAYTARFIFPMLSLEGRKFWILGLLPLDRSRLVWGKFAFAAVACVLAGEFVSLLGNLMLGIPAVIVCLHVVTIATMALGLSGLSVGLGTCLPSFREIDPSKIVMGFGGTLNVVAGLLLLMVVVPLMALPAHLVYSRDPDQALGFVAFPWWVWLPHFVGLLVGLAGAIAPVRAGVRRLRAMEF